MSADSDLNDAMSDGGDPAPQEPLAAEWRAILENCRSIAPESDAWDWAGQFVSAVAALAEERRAERDRLYLERRQSVSAARSRLRALATAMRSTPGSEGIAAEIERVLDG